MFTIHHVHHFEPPVCDYSAALHRLERQMATILEKLTEVNTHVAAMEGRIDEAKKTLDEMKARAADRGATPDELAGFDALDAHLDGILAPPPGPEPAPTPAPAPTPPAA